MPRAPVYLTADHALTTSSFLVICHDTGTRRYISINSIVNGKKNGVLLTEWNFYNNGLVSVSLHDF